MYVTYPSGKEPIGSVFRERKLWGWLDESSVKNIETIQMFCCLLGQLAAARGFWLVWEATLAACHCSLQCAAVPRPDNVKVKTCSTPIKTFSAAICYSFHLKIWSSFETTYCSIQANLFSSSKAPGFFMYFFLSLLGLLRAARSRFFFPAVITAKAKLIEKRILILTGKALLEVGEKDERDFRH